MRILVRGVTLGLACALTTSTFAKTRVGGAGEQFVHVAGIELGRVTLSDVRSRYGPAPLVSTGDAGGAVSSLCYWLAANRTMVVFQSGELGGKARDVLGVEVSAHHPRPPHCRAVSPGESRGLRGLPAGLALGARPPQVAATLGLPRASSSIDRLQRIFASKRRVGSLLADVTVTVRAQFAGAPRALTGISIYRVLTN